MPLRPQTLFASHAKQHPAVNGGNVAIISADNPRFPAETQGTDALAQELDRLGLDYELTKGKYGAPEKSFIIQNPDLAIVLDLARRFGQESVAWSENGRHQLHYVNGPQAGMATVPSEEHEWSEQEPQDNYTAVPGPHGDPWGYFTWNIDFNSPLIPSQQNFQPRAPSAAPMPAPPQGTPSPAPSPAPSPSMTKSVVESVREWMEHLGALRTRELAKSIKSPECIACGSRNTYESSTRRGETHRCNGCGEHFTPGKAHLSVYEGGGHQTPPKTGHLTVKKAETVKSEYDAGSAISMVQGDMSHRQSKHGGPMKKSDEYERARIRSVRERESKELATIPLRDPSRPPWPKQSGVVPSIAEERTMKKSDPVDPLESEMAGKHACKGCGASFSPVVAALRKSKGGMCLKCEGSMAKGELKFESDGVRLSIKKGELKYQNNEPQHGQMDNAWKPKEKEPYKATGSGGQVTKNPVGSSSNPGAASTTFPMKKGEGMSTPKAPGAGAGMGGGSARAGGSSPPKMMPLGRSEGSSDADLTKPSTSGAQHRAMAAAASGNSTLGIPKKVGQEFLQADKGKRFKKNALHKALEEQVSLRKTSVPGGMNVAAQHGARTPAPAPLPTQPKPQVAPAFHPASPGAAAAPPVSKKGMPIPKLTGIRGAPLSKPRV